MDSGNQAPQAWLLGVQRKLYQWSRENPEEPYCDLWNWVTDPLESQTQRQQSATLLPFSRSTIINLDTYLGYCYTALCQPS